MQAVKGIAQWPTTHSSEPWNEDPELLTSKLLLSPYTALNTFMKELRKAYFDLN